MKKIEFISDDEKELAEAFVKLVRAGKVSCLPNNTYLISDNMYSYIMLNHNEFPSFNTFVGETKVVVLFGEHKIEGKLFGQKPKTDQELIETYKKNIEYLLNELTSILEK